jgi:hypothetical protein
MGKVVAAELLGTFWLVFGGCGSAVLAAAFPDVGIGLLGVSLAFGLTVLTMAYTIGHISGCHLNPAVSIGLCVAGRFPAAKVLPYAAAQVAGAVLAAGVLYITNWGNSTLSRIAPSGLVEGQAFDSRRVVEISQRPKAAPATQRGYLRYVMQMCEMIGEKRVPYYPQQLPTAPRPPKPPKPGEPQLQWPRTLQECRAAIAGLTARAWDWVVARWS